MADFGFVGPSYEAPSIYQDGQESFYVYQHRKTDTNEIFYVGKGINSRANDKNKRSDFWKNVEAKHGRTIEYLIKNISEEFAFLIEIETINAYRHRGIKLVNLTNGGEGTSGYKYSKESKLKMSVAKQGKTSPRKNVKLSDETKNKISISGKNKAKKSLRKLNKEQVAEIRSLHKIMSHQKIANKFNVSKYVIFSILHNINYVED